MFLQDWGFYALFTATFLTSILSGMAGMAGGIILLGLMVSWVQLLYIIPLHGAIQTASSASRTVLFFKSIRWRILIYFSIGIIPGALIGLRIFTALPPDIFKILLAGVILAVTWLPKPKPKKRGETEFFFLGLGFVSAMLSTVVGATGSFVAPFFLREDITKDQLIATKSTCQGLVHLAKIPVFGFVGINLFTHWSQLLLLCFASFAGIWVGKRFLHAIPDRLFFIGFKVLLTIIAFRIIAIQLEWI